MADAVPRVYYIFASPAEKTDPVAAFVFYSVEGEALAKALCDLFAREYGNTTGQSAFRYVAAGTLSIHEQVLLDEALDSLVMYIVTPIFRTMP